MNFVLFFAVSLTINIFQNIEAACPAPPMNSETQAVVNLLSSSFDILNTTNITVFRSVFGQYDLQQDFLYRQQYNYSFYASVNEMPINGIINPGDNTSIPCTAFIPNEYKDDSPILIFLHGGGFVISDILTYRATLTHIAATLQLRIVYADYRRAPEFGFPKGSDDCLYATKYILENKLMLFPNSQNAKVGLIGDSAGGSLAAYVANTLTKDLIAFHILIYPTVSFLPQDLSGGSFELFKDIQYLAPLLTPPVFANYLIPAINAFGPNIIADPKFSPILGVSENTPPALIIVSQLDILKDQGIKYKEVLKAYNVDVDFHEISGVTHFFFQLPYFFPVSFQTLLIYLQDFLAKY